MSVGCLVSITPLPRGYMAAAAVAICAAEVLPPPPPPSNDARRFKVSLPGARESLDHFSA